MRKNEELKKTLTTRDIWCLALGAMIGFGCFVLPGNSFLPEAGPLGTALGLAIGAVMVMVISASFSYLIQKMPKSGGSFLYATSLFGKAQGFILGWFMVLTYWSLVPLNATALGLIGRNLFPGVLQQAYLYNIAGFDVYLGEILVALVFIVGVAWINLKGAKSAGWTQTAITAGLIGSVLLVAGGVLFSKPDLANLSPAYPVGVSSFQAIFAIVAMTPWAFVGFDCIPQAAEEFSFPPKKAMKIMFTAIGAAALMYIIVNSATAVVTPWTDIVNESWATGAAVKAVLGNFGLIFVGIAMMCAVLSGMNAFLLSASRLLYAMSRVDALPTWFGKVDSRSGVPRNAIILLSVLAIVTPFLGRQVINWVVDMTSVGASLSFAYACAAAFKLSLGNKEKKWMIVSGAGFLMSLFFLGLMLIPGSPGFLSIPSLCALGIWTVLGIVMFFLNKKRYYESRKLCELQNDNDEEASKNMEKTLFYGGTILTMDPNLPTAEALVIENGKICDIGTFEEMKNIHPDAALESLGGKTLIPSFVDGHSHMAIIGLNFLRCDLIGCTGFEDMLDRIRKFREERDLTHGEPISARGYDIAIMKEGKHPNAAVLDTLGFDNPIYCTHLSGHMLACNTYAMKDCGIDDDFVFPSGGHAERDENGHLTGFFEENAKNVITSRYDKFTDEQCENAILEAQEYYLRYGITTIQDGGSIGRERFACYERLASAGKLKADVVVYLSSDLKDLDFWEEAIQKYGNRQYCNHLKIGGIKLFLDGSPQARTAWMRAPYENGDPEYCGYPILTDEEVYQILCAAIDYDLQPLAHCNGDAASEQFISAWEKALATKGKGKHLRPVMIHAQTVGYDQLDRMAKIGMMPSFFVGHCYYWGDTHLINFGQERGNRISPVNAAILRNLPYSFHQDSPVTPADMMHSVWCAVNRLTRNGVCIGAENRINVQQALIGVTHGAAYSYFEEDQKGILKKEAVADLVILDQDPTTVEPMALKDISVLSTIKDGTVLYSK